MLHNMAASRKLKKEHAYKYQVCCYTQLINEGNK